MGIAGWSSTGSMGRIIYLMLTSAKITQPTDSPPG